MYDSETVQALLRAAMQVSPNGKVQQGFSEMTWEPGLTHRQICQNIIDGMSDGMRHGNWPMPSSK